MAESIDRKYYGVGLNPLGDTPEVRRTRAFELKKLDRKMVSLGYKQFTNSKELQRAKLLANIADNRKALSSSNVSRYFRKEYEMSDEGQAGLLRSAIENERRKKEHRARMSFRRTTASDNKNTQTNIEKGVQKAFGGKSVLKDVAKGMGIIIGSSSGIRMMRYAMFGASFDASMRAQRTALGAASTGSTFNQFRTLGNVARIFGGSESDAGAVLGAINALVAGSTLGYGLGPLEEFVKFGANLYPGQDKTEALYEIADTVQRLEAQQKGSGVIVAQRGGIPAALIRAMEGGRESLDAYIKRYGNPLDDSRIEELEEQQIALNNALVKWDAAMDKHSNLFTSQIEMFTDAFDFILSDFGKSVEFFSGVGDKIGSFFGKSAQWSDDVLNSALRKNGFRISGHSSILGMPLIESVPNNVRNPEFTAREKLTRQLPPLSYDSVPQTFHDLPQSGNQNTYNLNFSNMIDTQSIVNGVKKVVSETNGTNAVIRVINEPDIVSENM